MAPVSRLLCRSPAAAVTRPPAIPKSSAPQTVATSLWRRPRSRHSAAMAMTQERPIHASANRPTSPSGQLMESPTAQLTSVSADNLAVPAPLSVLPLRMVLRSLAITAISASPALLSPSLVAMSFLAHSTNPLLNPDRNPLLRYFLKKTFYAQFCAGENATEVKRTVARLKDIGFTGVILGYAREVVLSDDQTKNLAGTSGGAAADECIKNEVIPWATGTMETVRLAQRGDFVALKFTGAGRQALYNLSQSLPPPPALAGAIDPICALAVSRGVGLLFDAEQQAVQPGIDAWTLDYMRRYNTTPGHAAIYGTYQAYLKSTPQTLSQHLATAQAEGFTLGVKLVRGAYLGSDPRELIHDTKADTDESYNAIAKALLTRQWDGQFLAGSGPFPNVSLVLASHNAESVARGRAICESGHARAEVAFAQLQGMADEVSCDLVSAVKASTVAADSGEQGSPSGNQAALRTYKYLVWGTTGECMKYLLRRAQENRDAVQRTKSGRDAMWSETVRRLRRSVGIGA